MWRTLTALALFVITLPAVTGGDYRSAKRKIDQIQADRAPSGTRITLTANELNAWVRAEVPPSVRGAMRSPTLELGHGSATGSAWIDFVKLRTAQGSPPGWLLRTLLDGEHPVRVTANVRSGAGRAVVDVQEVEVSGFEISGRALDYMVRNFLLPRYPNAKIGEPFEMGHRIERLDIAPAGVGVVIGK